VHCRFILSHNTRDRRRLRLRRSIPVFGHWYVIEIHAAGLTSRSSRLAQKKPDPLKESERERERVKGAVDFLISRKMESFSRASALHAHPLSRAVIKQIEPLPSRRNKLAIRSLLPLPLALFPLPLPKSRNLNKFTSVCTRINFTSFLVPLSFPPPPPP